MKSIELIIIDLNNPINLFLIGLMLMCFLWDFGSNKDFRSVIVSIGVFGTFLGILIGLGSFDTSDIDNSVPKLLEGLKTAFLTSVAGMFLSVILSIKEKMSRKTLKDSSTNELLSFSVKLQEGTDKKIGLIYNHFLSFSKKLDNNFNTTNELLSSSVKLQEGTDKKIGLIYNHFLSFSKKIDNNFNTMEDAMNKALDKMSKGATEEIIKALETVIKDFNNNLTEQFGDNFKKLNEAVLNMIGWQENYKTHIETTENLLKEGTFYMKENVTQMQEVAQSSRNLTEHFSRLTETNKKLQTIIETNHNQIQNLETHIKNLKKFGDDLSITTESVENFSKTIQQSLSNQSEGINKLSEHLKEEIKNSTNNLSEILSSITNKFGDDYQNFLNTIRTFITKNENNKFN